MIEPDDMLFPNNVVMLLEMRLPSIDPEIEVFRRPLRDTDPIQAFGVFATLWTPNEDSYEFGTPAANVYAHHPTLQNYTISIQGLVKDMDPESGLAKQSVMAKRLRAMLYRDAPLRVGLTSLASQLGGLTERLQRWGVRQQRFISNEVQGQWMYLSTLDLWIETEETV